jgi:hypothetical protein
MRNVQVDLPDRFWLGYEGRSARARGSYTIRARAEGFRSYQIFTADPETVEPLPKHNVLQHLSTIGPQAEIAYLEFLIDGHGDTTAECHERLAELYLDATQQLARQKAKKRGAIVVV